jgi:putative flippase GtrA
MTSTSPFRRLVGQSPSAQVVRYILVGAWNTLFGFLCFVVIWYVWGESLGYAWTLAITIVISVIQSYFTQRLLVWRSDDAVHRELPRFVLVYAVTYVGNLALLWILVDHVGLPVVLSQALATAVVVVCSFFLLRGFAFAGRSSEADVPEDNATPVPREVAGP